MIPRGADRRRDRPGWVKFARSRLQRSANLHSTQLCPLMDLVSDAPENHARMITVTQDHGLQIA
jgi:hypothetical protein